MHHVFVFDDNVSNVFIHVQLTYELSEVTELSRTVLSLFRIGNNVKAKFISVVYITRRVLCRILIKIVVFRNLFIGVMFTRSLE